MNISDVGRRRVAIFFIAALLIVAGGMLWTIDSVGLRYTFENLAFTLDPSAVRAYTYAERHFDAQSPALYDVDRAAHFFNLAAVKDPTLPYVFHELARIDFLKGRYPEALAKIDFQISLHGDSTPNSYYIRGLIEGYMGDYDAAARDYAHFLKKDPHNWAAINDYAWVLLKAGRFQEAADVTAAGLVYFPDNTWLLNSSAIALYELGAVGPARERIQVASETVNSVTEAAWLHAYPGNDPAMATQGIAALQASIAGNMHMMLVGTSSNTLQ